MTSIKWFAVFSVCLLLPSISKACYWYPENESYRYSAFNPMGIPTSPYKPFFFSAKFLNDYENIAGQENDRTHNIQEWSKYLRGQVPEKDIYAVLYKIDAQSFIEIENPKLPHANDSLATNKFFQFLKKPQNKKLYDYIAFSKRCETLTSFYGDPWEDDERDTAAIIPLWNAADAGVALKLDTFLHQRYVFQAIRLGFYTFNKKHLNLFITEFANSKTTSILKPWAMLYYANSLNNDTASYLYAKVFRLCDEKKGAAFQQFDNKRLNAVLALAQNDEERADIIALSSLKQPIYRLPEIIKVAKLSPNNPTLELMITREINKCEDWLMTNEVNGFAPAVIIGADPWWDDSRKDLAAKAEKKSKGYASQLYTYLQTCTKDDRFKNQAFMNLATAHMAFILKDDNTAIHYLELAEKQQKNASEGIQIQIQLTKLMAEARMTKAVDEVFERKIFNSITLLKQRNTPDAKRMLEQFMAFLSSNYLHQGDVAKATLCRAHSNAYFNVPNIELVYYDVFEEDSIRTANLATVYLSEVGTGAGGAQLIALLDKKHKTDYERLLTAEYVYPEYKYPLLDVVGTLYLREDSLKEALEYFSMIPATYWHGQTAYHNDRYRYLDANPFYAHIGNNHRCCAADTVMYNKYSFTKKMVALKAEAAATHNPKTLLTIAHAYFNMTNYGNSWQLARSFQSNNMLDVHRTYNNEYYGCIRATLWYQQALNASTDKETQAVCVAMLAQCEKGMAYWKSPRKEDYEWAFSLKKFPVNTYLKQLVTDYKDTKYYAEILAECGGRDQFMWSFRNTF